MRNRHKFTFIIFILLADLAAIIFGTLLFLRFASDASIDWDVVVLSKMIPIAILSWLFSVAYFRLYRVDSLFSLEAFYRSSWRSFLVQIILWQSYIFIVQDSLLLSVDSSANLFQLSFLLFYFLSSRILFTLILGQIKKCAAKPYAVAIWGFNKTSIELASHLETNSCFIHFEGIINEDSSENYKTKETFSSALTEAIHTASDNNLNELYIVAKPDFITDLNYYFELGDKYCMRLKFVPDFSPISKVHFSSSNFDNFHVIKPRHEPLQNPYNRLIKRVFDIVFSSIIIVFILSWLYPILALMIKKESKGPILFKQLRTGKKRLLCYNLKYDCQLKAIIYRPKEDARVTKIGKFIDG
jgi:putative colanic acid biosynthesis UDP-glucose lipid carrier transferase